MSCVGLVSSCSIPLMSSGLPSFFPWCLDTPPCWMYTWMTARQERWRKAIGLVGKGVCKWGAPSGTLVVKWGTDILLRDSTTHSKCSQHPGHLSLKINKCVPEGRTYPVNIGIVEITLSSAGEQGAHLVGDTHEQTGFLIHHAYGSFGHSCSLLLTNKASEMMLVTTLWQEGPFLFKNEGLFDTSEAWACMFVKIPKSTAPDLVCVKTLGTVNAFHFQCKQRFAFC